MMSSNNMADPKRQNKILRYFVQKIIFAELTLTDHIILVNASYQLTS